MVSGHKLKRQNMDLNYVRTLVKIKKMDSIYVRTQVKIEKDGFYFFLNCMLLLY